MRIALNGKNLSYETQKELKTTFIIFPLYYLIHEEKKKRIICCFYGLFEECPNDGSDDSAYYRSDPKDPNLTQCCAADEKSGA